MYLIISLLEVTRYLPKHQNVNQAMTVSSPERAGTSCSKKNERSEYTRSVRSVMSVMSVKSVMSVRSHKSKYTPTYGVFYLSLRAFNRLCVSWYVHVIAFDLTAFIGQQESSQSLGCFCDTHLLRSVIKLFKLGRLDNHWCLRIRPTPGDSLAFIFRVNPRHFSNCSVRALVSLPPARVQLVWVPRPGGPML